MKARAACALYPALFLSSFATLGFEVLLTRIFSIALWYHFGHMVVSIAMLGIGLSGTFYAVRTGSRERDEYPRPELFVLLSASMVVSYLLAVRIPFDPVRLSWDRGQLLLIGLYYLTLSLPFFFAGLVLVSAFGAPGSKTGLVYGSDLMGAAAGCVAVFWVLWWFTPGEAVVLFALLPLAGAWTLGRPLLRTGTAAAGACLVGILLLSPQWLQVPLSPYKELPALLQFEGARTVSTLESPYGRIDLFHSPGVRYAPGLSLAYAGQIPAQLGLAVDGGTVTAVTPASGKISLGFLKEIPAAAAYELRGTPRVFIVNPGGGLPTLLGRLYGASQLDAVEENPAIIRALSGIPALTGPLYPPASPAGFGRNYMARSGRTYDIVDLSLTAAVSSGGNPAGEAYAFTVEAFRSYLRGLATGGVLSVTTFIVPPFRTELRVLSTLLTALESSGIAEPEKHIFVLRSLEVLLILAREGPFEDREVALLKEFARKRWFDLVYYAGITEDETRRHIRTWGPDLTAAVSALLDPAARPGFIESYVFDIAPTTDDRPFFHEHLRFSRIRETYELVQKKWDFFIREGYLTSVILVQILLAGVALTVLPAYVSVRRRWPESTRTLLFFACLGFGYMAVEVPLIQKLVLPLEHPAVAFAAAVGILLVASGLGSVLGQNQDPSVYLGKILVTLGLFAIPVYVLLFPWLGERLSALHEYWRVPVLALFLFPMGVLMGMPFPAAMAMLGRNSPGLVPWAWAINGFLSVLTPILSVVVAWRTGLSLVMLMGAAAYVLAYFSSRGLPTSPVMGTKTTGVV